MHAHPHAAWALTPARRRTAMQVHCCAAAPCQLPAAPHTCAALTHGAGPAGQPVTPSCPLHPLPGGSESAGLPSWGVMVRLHAAPCCLQGWLVESALVRLHGCHQAHGRDRPVARRYSAQHSSCRSPWHHSNAQCETLSRNCCVFVAVNFASSTTILADGFLSVLQRLSKQPRATA